MFLVLTHSPTTVLSPVFRNSNLVLASQFSFIIEWNSSIPFLIASRSSLQFNIYVGNDMILWLNILFWQFSLLKVKISKQWSDVVKVQSVCYESTNLPLRLYKILSNLLCLPLWVIRSSLHFQQSISPKEEKYSDRSLALFCSPTLLFIACSSGRLKSPNKMSSGSLLFISIPKLPFSAQVYNFKHFPEPTEGCTGAVVLQVDGCRSGSKHSRRWQALRSWGSSRLQLAQVPLHWRLWARGWSSGRRKNVSRDERKRSGVGRLCRKRRVRQHCFNSRQKRQFISSVPLWFWPSIASIFHRFSVAANSLCKVNLFSLVVKAD